MNSFLNMGDPELNNPTGSASPGEYTFAKLCVCANIYIAIFLQDKLNGRIKNLYNMRNINYYVLPPIIPTE